MRTALLLVLAVAAAGCLAATNGPGSDSAEPPAVVTDPEINGMLHNLANNDIIRISTAFGDIDAVLYGNFVPGTAGHLGQLVRSGFYDGTIIHRVVDDFVIQGGDPTGTGEGGSGTMIPLEIEPGLHFGIGSIGLARWTDDTGDSQWFIVEKPQPHLSQPTGPTGEVFGAYSMFGQVIRGMDVVMKIAAVETIPQLDRPINDVDVSRVEVLETGNVTWRNVIQDYHVFPLPDKDGFLQHPRYLFDGQPFPAWWVEDTAGVAPQGPIVAVKNGTTLEFPTTSHPDTHALSAEVTLPAGSWELGFGENFATVEVRPWAESYAAYDHGAHP